MIVFRREQTVKIGRSMDALETFKWMREQLGTLGPVRILYKKMGSGHVLAEEWEFENLGEYEKWYGEYWASFAKMDWQAKFPDMSPSSYPCENIKCMEMWDLIE